MNPDRDQQTMEIFLAAIELPGDRRGRYLNKVCGSDQELRAEIESLLKHHVPDTLVADDADSRPAGATEWPSHHGRTRSAKRWLANLLPRRFGLAAIVLAACFAPLWYLTHRSIEEKLRANVEAQLQTVLNADVAAIEIWLAKQEQMAENWADHHRVRKTLSDLARLSSEEKLITSELESTPVHAEFLATISPLLAEPQVSFVGVFGEDGHAIAKCPHPPVKDVYWSSRGAALIWPCFVGQTVFMPTFRPGSNVIGSDDGPSSAAAISIVAPVRDQSGDVIAAMQVVMDIDHEFATLFSFAQMGETGDSYAFDEHGVVLSNLRSEHELRRLGLIPEEHGAALHLQLRDPGMNLRDADLSNHGLQMNQSMKLPLCKVAASAISQGESIDAAGYRNYLGVDVAGAGRWLPAYNFGVATEIEYKEAYAPLRSLFWLFGGVFGLFASAALLAALLSVKNFLLRKQVHEARNLGQYTLRELIGQGGMAKVYRANHSLLRRETAIKLIQRSETGQQMVERFEREAQLASELTHPNTIQIYDYGHTDDGTFYFAMEYLPGITLADLIVRDGPLPPARVVHILRQIGASLCEAHGKGLIHRDIKPANIMLCERGGQYDFVKVLDFGLVSNVLESNHETTGRQDLAGTPLYIAPERIRRSAVVDARSDIYSLGTVAFYLLTGQPLFDGDTSADVLYKVVNEIPRYPSEVSSTKIPAKLDVLVKSCLEKQAQDRPADVGVIIEVLDSLTLDMPWTQDSAARAWRRDSVSARAALQPTA